MFLNKSQYKCCNLSLQSSILHNLNGSRSVLDMFIFKWFSRWAEKMLSSKKFYLFRKMVESANCWSKSNLPPFLDSAIVSTSLVDTRMTGPSTMLCNTIPAYTALCCILTTTPIQSSNNTIKIQYTNNTKSKIPNYVLFSCWSNNAQDQ